MRGPGEFFLGYLGERDIFLSYAFSGTFAAPYTMLSIGQAEKEFKGSFIADRIEVHQDAEIRHVKFRYPFGLDL